MRTPKTILNSAASAIALGAMTPVERARGRYMRSPEGHGDGGGDSAPSDASPAPSPAPTPAPVDDAGDDAGDDDASPLGGAVVGDNADGAADGGDGADPQPRPGAPEKYELSVPADLAEKGVEFDAETFGKVEPLLREFGLSNDEAQKLVDAYAGEVMPTLQQRAEGQALDQAKTLRKEWSDAFDADPAIGGENRDATLSAAARAFDHYGLKKNQGLRQLLDESGLGFHPDMIRFVAGVGRDLAEGSFERGSAASARKSPEQKLYGDEFQPKQ